MNINDLYPSKYIKADDIQGQQVPVTIASISIEEVGDKDHKPVLKFIGKEKGMVLNKTNALACASIWGDETNAWSMQTATLLAQPVMFQGRQTMGLAILPNMPNQAAPAPAPVPQPTTNPGGPATVLNGPAAAVAAQAHAVDPMGELDDLPF